jgi:GTP cyclohydrolase IA
MNVLNVFIVYQPMNGVAMSPMIHPILRSSSHLHHLVAPARPEPFSVDHERIARAVREILIAVGENPDRDGLLDTPERVARAYAETFAGLREDAAVHLGRTFEHEAAGDDVVVLRHIEFASLCEHHLAPFLGHAHIAYLPSGGRVTGLSKLARTVDVFARRPQLQERLTAQIADALVEHLRPRGVAVLIEGEHMCMRVRGAKKAEAKMVTTAIRGVYTEDRELRREALSLMRGDRTCG